MTIGQATEGNMGNQIQKKSESQRGAIVVPAIMWMAGVPLTVVLLLWLLFFRG